MDDGQVASRLVEVEVKVDGLFDAIKRIEAAISAKKFDWLPILTALGILVTLIGAVGRAYIEPAFARIATLETKSDTNTEKGERLEREAHQREVDSAYDRGKTVQQIFDLTSLTAKNASDLERQIALANTTTDSKVNEIDKRLQGEIRTNQELIESETSRRDAEIASRSAARDTQFKEMLDRQISNREDTARNTERIDALKQRQEKP